MSHPVKHSIGQQKSFETLNWNYNESVSEAREFEVKENKVNGEERPKFRYDRVQPSFAIGKRISRARQLKESVDKMNMTATETSKAARTQWSSRELKTLMWSYVS